MKLTLTESMHYVVVVAAAAGGNRGGLVMKI